MIRFSRDSYTALSNDAWVIRRALAEKHDCKASQISWKACLLLALAADREEGAAQARAQAAALLPKRSILRDCTAFALAVLDTLKPSSIPVERVAGLAVVLTIAAIAL